MNNTLSVKEIEELKRWTKLKIKADGTLVLHGGLSGNQKEKADLALRDLEKVLDEKQRPFLLSIFNEQEVILEEGLTLFSLLKGLQPWYNYLNINYAKDFQSYLDFFEKSDEVFSKSFEILISKIHFLRKKRTFKEGVDLLSVMLKKGDIKSLEIKSDLYTLNQNLHVKIKEVDQNGNVSYTYSDPCDEIEYLKHAKITLSSLSSLLLQEGMINKENQDIVKTEDPFGYFVPYKNDFVYTIKLKECILLKELLDILSSLLYFHHPISQQKQHENYLGFVEKMKEVEKKESDPDGDHSLHLNVFTLLVNEFNKG